MFAAVFPDVCPHRTTQPGRAEPGTAGLTRPLFSARVGFRHRALIAKPRGPASEHGAKQHPTKPPHNGKTQPYTDQGRRKAHQRNEARSQENEVSVPRERGGGNKDEAKKVCPSGTNAERKPSSSILSEAASDTCIKPRTKTSLQFPPSRKNKAVSQETS